MTEETHRTQVNETRGGSNTGLVDVLVAELEGDDGASGESLRRALELEHASTSDDIARIENDLGALRADVDERKAAEAELRARIDNNLEPRLDTVDRRLRELEERTRDLESDTRGLRSELTAVTDSFETVDRDRNAPGDDADLDALADDLDDLERTVATAFDTVTSDLETDLERLRSSLQDDIDALERRLAALEEMAGIDPEADGRNRSY